MLTATEYPAGLQREINATTARLASYSRSVYLDRECAEQSKRLEDLRGNWERMKDNLLVRQMTEIVESTVTNCHADFYLWDLDAMTRFPDVPFLWVVRSTGTHIVWLEGSRRVVQSNRDFLRSVYRVWGDEQVLYHAIPANSTLRKLDLATTEPSSLPFKIREDGPITS